jgi:hypothetical protein
VPNLPGVHAYWTTADKVIKKLMLLRYRFWQNALKWQNVVQCPSALPLRLYNSVAICQS